jgi:four helix bundle protein
MDPPMGKTKRFDPPFDLPSRLIRFAKRGLEICKKLPNDPECKRIRGQLGAAVTSVGANYEEADAASSRKELSNKMSIARKEAKETRYFLQVINETYLSGLEEDIQEADELIRILSRMIYKTRSK